MSLDVSNDTLCSVILETNGGDDGFIEDLVELTPELVELFDLEHDPGAHQVHTVDHQLQLMLEHLSFSFIGLSIDDLCLLLDQSEEIPEQFVKQG